MQDEEAVPVKKPKKEPVSFFMAVLVLNDVFQCFSSVKQLVKLNNLWLSTFLILSIFFKLCVKHFSSP